mgnify:FL=1
MSASERQAYLKYKKQLRLDLNKKYPKGGAEFIKELRKITSFNFNKYKALGIKSVSNEVVKAKINNSKKTNKNIVKAKKEIEKVITAPKKESPQPKAMPQSIKDMRAKNKAKEDSKNKVKKEVKKDAEKDITKMRTSDVKMVTLKSGKKGTIKQRMAELDADKEKAQRAKNSPKTNKALDAVFAMFKKSKEKTNTTLKNGGMTMKKKTKMMSKGGYGTATKKMSVAKPKATKMMGGGYAMKKKK